MAGYQAPAKRIDPQPPSPSLLTAARDRSGDGFGAGDWTRGVKWNSGACTRSAAWQQACQTNNKPHGALAGLVAVDPFWVITPIECDWTTMVSEGALDGLVDELNDAHAAYVMSRALWLGEGLAAVATDAAGAGDYGAVTVNPTLRSAAVDLSLETGAQPVDEAIPALIAAWRECTGGNGLPTVHVPEVAVPYLFGSGSGGGKIIERQGDALVIPSVGARLSPGPGYPDGISAAGTGGYGPATGGGNYAGNANNELWVYVTGPVEYARGEKKPVKSFGNPGDASNPADYARQNRYETIAESQALVRFDPCCVLAQLVQSPVGPVS